MPSTGTRPSRAAWRGGRGRPGHKGDHKQGEEGPEMVSPPPARQRAKKVDANPDVSPSSRPDEPPRGKGTGAALRAASSHDDVVSPPSSTVPNHSVQPPRPRYSMDQVLRHLDTASTQPAHQGKRRHVQDTPPTVQQVIPPPSPVSSHDEVYTPRIPFQSLVDSHASAVDTGAPRYLPSSRSRTPVLPSRPQTWREEMEFRLAAIMAPPPYSDDEVPLPKPYNAEYPHPISSYASHGCNAYVRRTSGYDLILQHLIDHDPDQLKGSILASANRDDIFPPSLTMLVEAGEGCSIPERLWTRFESFGAARVPIGIGASASYAPSLTSQLPSPSTPSTSYSTPFRPAAHVDHAPTTQYHSSSSHDSWHTPSVPPRFARSLSQSSSTTSLRQVGTASTCPSPSPFTREVDSYTYPLKSVYDEWSSLKKGSDPSPFFKTEMCQIWEDTGLCKYGTSCQFAHGLHELRNLPGLTALPTPPLDHTALPTEGFVPYRDTPSAYHGRYQQPADSTTLSEQYQYPRKSSVDSLTTPFYHTPSLSMSSRFEGRRASAPPSHLAPVLEVVDDDLPTPWWRENFARKQSLAPIGSERESSHGSNSNGSPPRHGDRERGIHGMTPSPSRGSKQYDQSPSQASMSSSSRYTRPDSAYGWTNTASTALETMATGPSTGATQSRGWIDEPITRLPKGTRAPITPETYLQASTPSPSKSAQRSNGAQGQDIFATTFDFPQSRSIWS